MTYPILVLPFALATAAVTIWTTRRPRFAQRMQASGLAAVVLVILTALFDNVMISAGLYSYPPALVGGLRIGLAPVEDLAYAACAAFLVPSVFALLPARDTTRARRAELS